MTEFLDTIMPLFKYLMIPSFLAGFVGLFAFSGIDDDNLIIRKKSRRLSFLLIGQLILIFILLFSTSEIIEFRARKELKYFLMSDNLIVKINNRKIPIDSNAILINELKSISLFKAHHSSPQKRIKIEISSNDETVRLELGQDSEIRTEYWIFWDKYKTTKENEFGRISTRIFESQFNCDRSDSI